MTSGVPCRFFLQGNCAFGDGCRFSHNVNAAQSAQQPSRGGGGSSQEVCRYFLQGNCARGSSCRYAHNKPSRSTGPSNYSAPTGVRKPSLGSGDAAAAGGAASATPNWDDYMTPDEMDEFEAWQAEQEAEEEAAAVAAGGGQQRQRGGAAAGGGGGDEEGDIMDPADIPLCEEYSASGQCSAGDECLYIHGDECEMCGYYCVHPYNPDVTAHHKLVCHQHVLHPTDADAAAAHAAECGSLAAKLAKRAADAAIECCICFERVLAKPQLSQRRFGLMSCEHAFCLGCIRNWRATGEVEVKTALRTCPVCRTPTHFITPSTRWPDSPEQKATIVEAYRAALASRDCALFDHGDGVCPFGTSCFYRHAYRDGRLEEVHLRRAGNADGDVKVIAPVTLSSFLEASLTAQLALSSRSRGGRGGGSSSSRQQQQQQQDGGRAAAADVAAVGSTQNDEHQQPDEQA